MAALPPVLSGSTFKERPVLTRHDHLVAERIKQHLATKERAERKRQSTVTVESATESSRTSPKLLIIANRLPLTVKKKPKQSGYDYKVSSGGLVSALRGVKGFDMLWIGWPGAEVPDSDHAQVIEEARKHKCCPVFLGQKLIDLYYNGLSNNVLWPLFHYIPPPMDFAGAPDTTAEQWEGYVRANQMFVDTVLELYEDGDFVWIHDYHLMLMPRLLREQRRDAKIGWFLHTPWPSQEMFRMLPFRTEVLQGLLSANLVCFHVYDYLRHFVSSCVQLLGLESSPQGLNAQAIGGCFVYCATIPIGIEPESFTKKVTSEEVDRAYSLLMQQFGSRKVILGVDRLDYMKGIPHKLNAFDRLLDRHPELTDNVVLVQLAVPSRTVVPEYQRLQAKVHELVGRIIGKHGSLASVPVHYLDQSLSFDELVALYRVADVCLITSLRDGMNLVSYEYVACQAEKCGVLILSEFAGAAQSLGAGSIRVNPWNVDETADMIHTALMMSEVERKSRHQYCFEHVHSHTSQKWAEVFMATLEEATSEDETIRTAIPPPLPEEKFLDDFEQSSKRLIVCDFLGSILTTSGGLQRFKSLMRLPPAIKEALTVLTNDPATTVIITSRQPRELLIDVFRDVPVCLAPENGSVYRDRKGEWVTLVPEEALAKSREWWDGVKSIFEDFTEHTPGSYVEETRISITWCWDDMLPDFGKQQARDVLVHLWAGPLSSSNAEVVLGARTVEARSPECGRANMMERILHHEFGNSIDDIDFIACIGNFAWRDEDVFHVFDTFGHKSTEGSETSPQVSRGLTGISGLCAGVSAQEGAANSVTSDAHGNSPDTPSPEPLSGEGSSPTRFVSDSAARRATVGDSSGKLGFYYSICVGAKHSRAESSLASTYHFGSLLRGMAHRLSASAQTSPQQLQPPPPLTVQPLSFMGRPYLPRQASSRRLPLADTLISPFDIARTHSGPSESRRYQPEQRWEFFGRGHAMNHMSTQEIPPRCSDTPDASTLGVGGHDDPGAGYPLFHPLAPHSVLPFGHRTLSQPHRGAAAFQCNIAVPPTPLSRPSVPPRLDGAAPQGVFVPSGTQSQSQPFCPTLAHSQRRLTSPSDSAPPPVVPQASPLAAAANELGSFIRSVPPGSLGTWDASSGPMPDLCIRPQPTEGPPATGSIPQTVPFLPHGLRANAFDGIYLTSQDGLVLTSASRHTPPGTTRASPYSAVQQPIINAIRPTSIPVHAPQIPQHVRILSSTEAASDQCVQQRNNLASQCRVSPPAVSSVLKRPPLPQDDNAGR